MRFGRFVRIVVVLAALVLGVSACSVRRGGSTPAKPEEANGFRTDVVVGGLIAPTVLAFLPDGRMLIAEQSGVIRLVKDGKLVPKPFLDIHREVNTYTERGLLGMAVDPAFRSNGYVYLLYTHEDDASRPKGPKTARLTRVTAHGDTASPGSEVVLVGKQGDRLCRSLPVGSDCIPQEWQGHSVGDIVFAPDGTLFLAMGDASNWNKATRDSLRAQNVDVLAGKILHVTRQGKGVPTNPFWNGDPDAARSKVWAYGLRNPFRFALSPWSGLPYLGDVGWNTWEEVDVATPGADLGWPCYEGHGREHEFGRMAACKALYAKGPSVVKGPLVTWRHTAKVRASAIGGSFNTGNAFPPALDGAYFYGDYIRSEIDYVQVDPHDRIVSGPWPFVKDANGLVDIKFGPDGTLYYLSITGELRRIRYTRDEQAAVPRLLGRPTTYATGTNPHSVNAADVNGDGRLDLVAADAGSNDAAVLLGTDDGRFAPPGHYATGLRPKVVVAADVNGDGSQDLVSANQDSNGISVLLGDGDGTFGKHRDYAACVHAHDVTAADLDGDGRLDLAVACFGGSVVSVLRGNGDGTFQRHVDYESGAVPTLDRGARSERRRQARPRRGEPRQRLRGRPPRNRRRQVRTRRDVRGRHAASPHRHRRPERRPAPGPRHRERRLRRRERASRQGRRDVREGGLVRHRTGPEGDRGGGPGRRRAPRRRDGEHRRQLRQRQPGAPPATRSACSSARGRASSSLRSPTSPGRPRSRRSSPISTGTAARTSRPRTGTAGP